MIYFVDFVLNFSLRLDKLQQAICMLARTIMCGTTLIPSSFLIISLVDLSKLIHGFV